MRLIYHPDAEAELIQAARFYKSGVFTLGSEFLDAADRAIAVIVEASDRWSIIESRRMSAVISCPAFPTLFTYRVFPDHIRILAFKHHSRHPDYWRYRLSD